MDKKAHFQLFLRKNRSQWYAVVTLLIFYYITSFFWEVQKTAVGELFCRDIILYKRELFCRDIILYKRERTGTKKRKTLHSSSSRGRYSCLKATAAMLLLVFQRCCSCLEATAATLLLVFQRCCDVILSSWTVPSRSGPRFCL